VDDSDQQRESEGGRTTALTVACLPACRPPVRKKPLPPRSALSSIDIIRLQDQRYSAYITE